jgi:hypothetical protein
MNTTADVLSALSMQTGCRTYVVKWEDGMAMCIAVAHDRTQEGLDLITRERVDRVKKAMEVDDEPSWYYPQ